MYVGNLIEEMSFLVRGNDFVKIGLLQKMLFLKKISSSKISATF